MERECVHSVMFLNTTKGELEKVGDSKYLNNNNNSEFFNTGYLSVLYTPTEKNNVLPTCHQMVAVLCCFEILN